MSGHNKWSKIKRKKGVADAARSRIFGRRIKEITVAVKEGGSADPEFNPRLRTAVINAKGDNMPRDTIERAIRKASESSGESYHETTYEGYGPGGVAVFVECTTDNMNRTVSNVRLAFTKHGGNMATSGSVDFLFDRKAVFEIPRGELDEEEFTLELIDAGVDDVEPDEGEFLVTAPMESFGSIQRKLDELGLEPSKAELRRIPRTCTAVDVETGRKMLHLIEAIEDDDDVTAVFHNMELTEELMDALAEA